MIFARVVNVNKRDDLILMRFIEAIQEKLQDVLVVLTDLSLGGLRIMDDDVSLVTTTYAFSPIASGKSSRTPSTVSSVRTSLPQLTARPRLFLWVLPL